MREWLAHNTRCPECQACPIGMERHGHVTIRIVQETNAASAVLQVLLNTMLREEQEHQEPALSSLTDGHAEDDRPKPCVPQSEQIRQDPSAAAKHSMPEEKAAGESKETGGGKQTAKALKIEWDFSHHVKYPLMRMRQVGKPR